MSTFNVRFIKLVSDSSGHEKQICQRVVEVKAQSSDEAKILAKTKFCALEGVKDWWMHAESVEVVEETKDQLADTLAKQIAAELHHSDLTTQDLNAAVERLGPH